MIVLIRIINIVAYLGRVGLDRSGRGTGQPIRLVYWEIGPAWPVLERTIEGGLIFFLGIRPKPLAKKAEPGSGKN
jgi:hypothetical protein